MANNDDFKGGSPWGSPPRGGGNGSGRGPRPPNIDEVIKKIQGIINKFIPGGKSGSSKPIILGLILLIVIWAFSGLYRVLPDEQGVVLRFGKFVSTTQPGLNYHIPYPVETVLTPKVTKVHRVDIGFRAASDSGRTSEVGDVPEESLMLTGDENIANIDFSVFWVIKDAGKFLFKIQSPVVTVKATAETAMREVIARSKLQSILTKGRSSIEIETQEIMQSLLDEYESGIQITQVQTQKADPSTPLEMFKLLERIWSVQRMKPKVTKMMLYQGREEMRQKFYRKPKHTKKKLSLWPKEKRADF